MNDQSYDCDKLLAAAKTGALQSSSWLLRGPSVAAILMVVLAVEIATDQFTAKIYGRVLLGVGGLATLISVSAVRWILTSKIHRPFVFQLGRIYRTFETIPGDDREWQAEVKKLLGSLRRAVFHGFALAVGIIVGVTVLRQLDGVRVPFGQILILALLIGGIVYLAINGLSDRLLQRLLIPADIRHLF